MSSIIYSMQLAIQTWLRLITQIEPMKMIGTADGWTTRARGRFGQANLDLI